MTFIKRWQCVALLCIVLSINVKAQYGYFYTGKDYGSEAYLSPATQIFNGSFDMLQTNNYTNQFKDFELRKGLRIATQSILHPFKTVQQIGFHTFAHSELIPFGFAKSSSAWIPNYALHFLGGGMEYARMTDYYTHHNFKYPRIWAAITSLTEQLLNEAVEMREKEIKQPSVVADWYFFNIPGIILYSFEPIQYFFSHNLIIRSWLGQSSVVLSDASLRNTGQYYSVKVQPKIMRNFSGLFYMGAGWLFGLGYDHKGKTFSLGYGTKTEEVFVLNEDKQIDYVKMTPSAGLFIDKNNSLLMSLVVTTHSVYQENIRLDVFPGVFKIGKISPGFWINYSFDYDTYLGITFKGLPGIGF
ncbi:MAG: hypothetical protein NXI08_13545 [bacterium]|nr:hypothetical protein [bacterium]